MAKLTAEEMGRLLAGTALTTRVGIMSPGSTLKPKDRNEAAAMREITQASGAARAELRNMTQQSEADGAIVLPSIVPARREESGLVDDSMELDESQLRALETLSRVNYGCLIGAAGTGKTTMAKRHIANHIYGGDGLPAKGIKQLDNNRLSIAICAFTGIATQVIKSTLPDWLQPSCTTIHGLLEFMPNMDAKAEDAESRQMFIPTRDAGRPLDQNFILIDEASMVGLDLWHLLLDACRPGTKLLLLGDLNQLTPVGDTSMFPIVLDAAVRGLHGWGIAELTKVHRQKEPGANRIIDTAHSILAGRRPVFDFEINHLGKQVDPHGKLIENPVARPDWRVINIQVPTNTDQAHSAIINWLNRFRGMRIADSDSMAYQPYDDLVLTAGNGYNPDSNGRLVQQYPINESLSEIITPEEEDRPTYIIDAGRETRKYSVGDRVMCLKNEPPSVKNRVTNGMLGVITDIKPNANWRGDRKKFGTKKEVDAFIRSRLDAAVDNGDLDIDLESIMQEMAADANFAESSKENTDRQASHIIEIEYKNGERRAYSSAADVANTTLGYAVTTHKAQGSQADTVFVIAHGAASQMLSREWLYTAVTRARKRVVVFSTDRGLRLAIGRQRIFGASLSEKIDRYNERSREAGKYVKLTPGNIIHATSERGAPTEVNTDSESESRQLVAGSGRFVATPESDESDDYIEAAE